MSTIEFSSCTWIGLLVIFIGSLGNWLCISVFLRKRFRSSTLSPFFVALLAADCLYLTFRVIKLLYYQDRLFHNFYVLPSCSSSLLIELYGSFTQRAPEIFLPFCHYEFYLRFSLLLMSFLAIQRAFNVSYLSYRLVSQSSSVRPFSYRLIVCALLLAYLFEFAGLNLFCSSQLSSTIAYQWYDYMRTNLSNETAPFLEFMKKQSSNQSEIDCLISNETICSHDKTRKIVGHYFDIHQRPIVDLIHKIQIATLGEKMGRNEIRVKYHHHICLIPLNPDFFLRIYDLLYSRSLDFNRYMIILVVGSIVPSLMTIISNGISLRSIITIRSSVNEQTRASRRRTEETRRVVIIITTECLLAILNSWFIDILLSVKNCRRSVAIGDDCPYFLREAQGFVLPLDLLNSISNIILHCFAGRRFRQELTRMLRAWLNAIRKRVPCYCQIQWKQTEQSIHDYEEQQPQDIQSNSSSRPSKKPLNVKKKKEEYIKLKALTYPTQVI